MNVPLYRREQGRNWTQPQGATANVGLVFDKVFGGWKAGFGDYDGQSKQAWVKKICADVNRMDWAAVKSLAGRQSATAKALGGETWKIKADARFVTGTGIANPLENGFVFHHTLGVPYLPASGLKGALRAYWTDWHGQETKRMERLLGTKTKAGSMVLFDLLPAGQLALEPEVMTTHYDDWYQKGEAPADWLSPVPIPMIAVGAGATFEISIAPRTDASADWTADKACLLAVLTDMLAFAGLGAKTAVGYGRFSGPLAAAR